MIYRILDGDFDMKRVKIEDKANLIDFVTKNMSRVSQNSAIDILYKRIYENYRNMIQDQTYEYHRNMIHDQAKEDLE